MQVGGYRTGGRVGAFLAVNNGTVEGCAAELAVTGAGVAGGFVYENNAGIARSVAVRCIRGKSGCGFYVKNGGSVTECGYIASPKARRQGKDGGAVYALGNGECYISGDTPADEIRQRLGLNGVWGNGSGLTPDPAANRQELPAGDDVIEIKSAADLQNMIQAVNSGDRKAACAHYRLQNDLNLKGAHLVPLGEDENHPFCGCFDGNGKTVGNFILNCRGREYGGFFGCTKNAQVANLSLDYILKGSGGVNVGGMAGSIVGGGFSNCHVRLAMSPGMCSGGFCGKNSGVIRNCYVGGKLSPPFPLVPLLLSGSAVLLVLLTVGTVTLVRKLTGDMPFQPEVIDPNQVPVRRPEGQDDPPPAGTNRISLELNHEIYIRASTMVGEMDYVNPHRSTQDVVIRLCISDAELVKAGYDLVACKVRTRQEMEAEGYDPEKAFTVLYSSQRLHIGYKLSYCKLSPLPNGETLKVGDYDMVMLIDAYDPQTNEKSIVNAQAVTTIHILDQ